MIYNYFSNEVQGNVVFVADKTYARRAMVGPYANGRTGVFVVMNEEDGTILGFVPSEMIKAYLALQIGRAVTQVEYARTCDVCVMALALVSNGARAETAVEHAAALIGGNEFVRMATSVFRGRLFQYHLFDSANPVLPPTHSRVRPRA